MRSLDSTTLTLSWFILGVVIAGLLVSLLALRYGSRPRVKVKLASAVAGRRVRTFRGDCGEALPLCLRVRMKTLSGRRGASEIELNIHVISEVLLHLARYGPTQELTSREVKGGKGASRSLNVSGVKVDKWEPTPFEDVELWLTAPMLPGRYLAWTTSFAHGEGGATGVSRFVFKVQRGRFRVRKVSYLGTWRLRVQRWFASPNPYDLPPFPSLERATW
jgi:hypothetical protein